MAAKMKVLRYHHDMSQSEQGRWLEDVRDLPNKLYFRQPILLDGVHICPHCSTIVHEIQLSCRSYAG